MTEKEFVTIINKKHYNLEDINILVDQYCQDTNRNGDDFSKIINYILHIHGLAEKAINNLTTYFKLKYNIVSVGDKSGIIYFYQSLN